MASTILVREALWRICDQIEDRSPQFNRFPESTLVQYLNDGQLAIATYLPTAASRIDVVKLKPGTRQSIEAIIPADCKPGDGAPLTTNLLGKQLLDVIRNMGTDGLTPGRAIRPFDREKLDTQRRTWHSSTGSQIDGFTFDPRTPRYFYVVPGVATGQQVWVEIAHTAQPITIPAGGVPGSELYKFDGASAVTLSLSDENIDDLVNYVVARVHLKNAQINGDGSKAATFVGLFVNSLNSRVTALTGHNPNLKRLPFAPEPLGAAA